MSYKFTQNKYFLVHFIVNYVSVPFILSVELLIKIGKEKTKSIKKDFQSFRNNSEYLLPIKIVAQSIKRLFMNIQLRS